MTQGVWFRSKRFVPYNRITNLEIHQGPISRHFKVGSVSIQTAGYSGSSNSTGRSAEAEINFIQNFEELKDTIISLLGKTRPIAVESRDESSDRDVNIQILDELKKIKQALEK